MKKIISLFALILLVGAGCSQVVDNKKNAEVKDDVTKKVNIKLEPEGHGYLNSESVLDRYKEEDLIEYKNEEERFSFKYPKDFSNVKINNFPGGTVFYGWTATDDEKKDAILNESVISDLSKDTYRGEHFNNGLEFMIDNVRNNKINAEKTEWSETEVISDIYEVNTDEFTGYAFDHTRDLGQHVGLPVVRTTATFFFFKNNRGDLYQINLVKNDDSKVILETLTFEE